VSVRASKHSLVRELFVRTADENYIAARWCAINQLNTDFLWLSVHALEKYLKAVLLINGRSSRGNAPAKKLYGHDIIRLYADVREVAGELLPDCLVRPTDLDIPDWSDRTPEQLMEHLLRNGNAHNRYLIYGYGIFSEDLHMVDAIVFAIRRLICPLDERWMVSDEPNAPTFTNRELLIDQPNYYGTLFMPLDDLIGARKDSPKRTAALNRNMAFAPDSFKHEPIRSGRAVRNPIIISNILDPLKSEDPRWAAEGVEIARWFLDNVQVPKGTVDDPGVTEQIEAAVEAARAKHGIP
jgi:hypothetical protein